MHTGWGEEEQDAKKPNTTRNTPRGQLIEIGQELDELHFNSIFQLHSLVLEICLNKSPLSMRNCAVRDV